MIEVSNMDYSLIPDLEHIALVKIVALLWNTSDIRAKIFWFDFFSKDELKKWPEVENLVLEKVAQLPLPEVLRRRVLGYVKPMGGEIIRWLRFHKNIYFGILHLPKEPCWTTQGFLDYKKIAETLIQDKTLHIDMRYKLACIYCLQNDIPVLWGEFPENLKKLFYNKKYSSEFKYIEFVVSLWTHEIEDEMLKFNTEVRMRFMETTWELPWSTPYQYAFVFSALAGNKDATEFFFQKLTPVEKEDSLSMYTKHVVKDCPSTQVFCLLISQMDDGQQLRLSRTMLDCLLDWPWQNFFVVTADRVCDFLSVRDYHYLLNKIVLKVRYGYQDWNYIQLFGQFWHKGTNTHKRYVLDECIMGSFLTNLFRIDISSFSLLVNDATVEEKDEIVYYRPDIIALLIYNNQWQLLKLLVEHLPVRDVVDKFQKEFLERDLCLEKKDVVEEKAMLKKFLIHLKNLLHGWAKEQAIYYEWRRIRRIVTARSCQANTTFINMKTFTHFVSRIGYSGDLITLV